MMTMRTKPRTGGLAVLLLSCGLVAGCTVGPDYHRPDAPVPARYKDLLAPPKGWSRARPDDGHGGGQWWAVFNDPTLNGLEARVRLNNQTIKEAAAAYRQAAVLVAEARAGLYPTLSATGSFQRGKQLGLTSNSASVEPSASWDLDVWGRIRRSVESSVASAQASAADLANAELSEQAVLAETYFDLCYQDALIDLLQRTVTAYQKSLTITQNQETYGVAALSDVITARAQLDAARSSLISAGVLRAEYEHAIAALVGVPAANFALPKRPLPFSIPVVPVAVPSTLLQRRPDIAAAERSMQAANAEIGVNVAAYYPDVSLSALFGYSADPVQDLFNVANQVWSLGTSVTETLFEGGLRHAEVAAAKAAYDESVATYRQTVLSAFQQVEDQLSSLRILAQQAQVQTQADKDAEQAVAIALNEYQAGTQAYTSVITEQTLLLSDQETNLSIDNSRLQATVSLAEALGGGFDATMLPAHPAGIGPY